MIPIIKKKRISVNSAAGMALKEWKHIPKVVISKFFAVSCYTLKNQNDNIHTYNTYIHI